MVYNYPRRTLSPTDTIPGLNRSLSPPGHYSRSHKQPKTNPNPITLTPIPTLTPNQSDMMYRSSLGELLYRLRRQPISPRLPDARAHPSLAVGSIVLLTEVA
ncbi:MAG: hypothetical protein GY820_21580 [Gammaproteobacteria bacterium]|nr:hypothetical protein [Gammaproteobacteria bacterium]